VAVRISRKEAGGVSDSAVSSRWSDGELVVENLPAEILEQLRPRSQASSLDDPAKRGTHILLTVGV
jgi:hypothetical protein